MTLGGGTSLQQRPERDGAVVTICDRTLSLTSKHTIMGLFKKFGTASGPVVLGRHHGVSKVMRSGMSRRVAAEYRAAGAAAGAPEIRDHDLQVSITKRASVHVDGSVVRRGSGMLGARPMACLARVRFAYSKRSSKTMKGNFVN